MRVNDFWHKIYKPEYSISISDRSASLASKLEGCSGVFIIRPTALRFAIKIPDEG